MRLSRPSSAGRRRALTAAAGALLGLGIAAPAGPALAAVSADPTASVTYPVNGTTVIKAVNSTLNLGPGKLAATVDLTTGALTANLTLPPATGSFTEFGFIPVTATTELVPNGPTTGKVNFAASSVQSTSSVFLNWTRSRSLASGCRSARPVRPGARPPSA